MKNFLLVAAAVVVIFLCGPAYCQQVKRCGIEIEKAALIARDPAWAARFEGQRAALQGIADDYIKYAKENAAERATSVPTVPVIFHIICTNAQFESMGGYLGIQQRVDSQIVILNRDFNAQNADSVLIPSCWKPLYGNSGIHFGLAHTSPTGEGTPGYEIEITNTCGFADVSSSYSTAKHNSTGGLDAWDVSKYYNVWCIKFVDDTTDCNDMPYLGLTVPLSYTGSAGFPVSEEGACILDTVLGNPGPNTGVPYWEYDGGRTLTHETGHFFEIWHTWGTDKNDCPWSGGGDDGLTDTPPQYGATYGNPAYTIPCGTVNDGCRMDGSVDEQPIGIACLSYLDYTDDIGMHLFTPMQAAAMAAMVLEPYTGATGATGEGLVGENYQLIQHPSLLQWPANTGVKTVTNSNNLNVFPNPATGIVNLAFNGSADQLNSITVVNMLGQQVFSAVLNPLQQNSYSIDLSAVSKGIYFVKCNFASGTENRTIILQ